MAVGDPACDLVISWTLLKGKSRRTFRENMNLDADTWARACGWALWKACFELISIKERTNPQALKQIQIINDILNEYVSKNH